MDGEAVQLGVQTRFDMACIRQFLTNNSLTLVPVSFIQLSFIPLPLYLCIIEWNRIWNHNFQVHRKLLEW